MNKRIKVIFPVPLSEHTRELIETQIPKEYVGAEYAVEFVGSKRFMSLADSYYDFYVMDTIILEAGVRAEEEGFDAVCINTVSDSGLYALRARLSIPVIAPGQSSFHIACTLGHKFSILTMWKPWKPMYIKTLRDYQLEDRLASIRHIDTRPDVQELLEGKEDIVFELLEKEGRKAVEEDGADVLVLGSTTMHQSHTYLQKRFSVPVLNPGVIAYKLCEMYLSLGLSHSKTAFPDPENIQDDNLFPG